ncbi:sucrose synthase [Nitrosomonas halophila]|uniref:Sucrose synthase n=1 Tax=Nitrosomonas halophila TaxID=44576 RepID=A0A1H3DIZ0_9PROT|nr:sucrose synthase [Nitrosomonas halophila]SDX66317.1 sucrose synthase [Nitrosomonas halophila]
MIDALITYTQQNRDVVYTLLRRYFALNRTLLLQSDLRHEIQLMEKAFDRSDALYNFVHRLQEGVFCSPWAYFVLRPDVAEWVFVRIHQDYLYPEKITVSEFLRFKETVVKGVCAESVLEIDFDPFGRGFPKLKETRSIGQGVIFLNRQLSSEMFTRIEKGGEKLLHFLGVHAIDGQQLMFTSNSRDTYTIRGQLRQALETLEKHDSAAPWSELEQEMNRFGFAPGWGHDAARVSETMNMLMDILEAPSPAALEAFLARIPMISRLLILSPHGYFGQDNVLGLPDTGGQVVYILDQVRALEKEMHDRLLLQGVHVQPKILIVSRLIPDAGDTTCNQRLEKVSGCENTWILRVPFHKSNGEIIPHWISRFEIWPHLEDFARDVEREALAELGGRPDLIIGNYSDGNLVATLLSKRLGVTQCNIAHALEKTKYLHSDLYWQENEEKYHFSCQYTADLLAMNAADFIVTSTYQEIAGTREAEGQYESYRAFSMPGLYRVVNGIDLFDPKFNIVSPGANADVYFAYTDQDRRLRSLIPEIDSMIFGDDACFPARGALRDPDKPLIFTMARLDRIKNITGLVEWYGTSQRLRSLANLVVVGGKIDPQQSSDHEEQEQIHRMHQLMDEFGLDQQVRWLGMRLDKNLAGELYRHIADQRGIFVQPALFEAFGLTIIEAMASGLPTFATRYGGPLEIIQHNRSGFHIDPTEGAESADLIADFLERSQENPGEWERISHGALDRVASRYTWKLYAERMMTLSRIYGFWKFVSGFDREEMDRYLNMFYHLQFRPLANKLTKDV